MKIKRITEGGSRRLILFMAGWGMDGAPFRNLSRPGYDVAVAWDYVSDAADWQAVEGYDEICLFAWSLGVAAAGRLIPEAVRERITRRVAVNGTDTPVSDSLGIPEAIFRGTLDGLDERNLTKFRRRMCGSREAYESFCRHLPDRGIDGLRRELEVFLDDRFRRPSGFRWDAAVVATADAIFPPGNQRRAWSGVHTEEVDAPHLMDFQSIIDRYAIDKETMGCRFAGGRDRYDRNAGAQAFVVGEMCRLMQRLPAGDAASAIEIGCGTGLLSRHIAGRYGKLELWDIAGESPLSGVRFRRVDAELELRRTPSGSADAIFSASTVQWFNSPARFLSESARVLRRGGYLLFSTFLPGNLSEVAQATGRSLPLLPVEEWRRLMPPVLAEVDVRSYEYPLDFDSPVAVFRHLKATGVNSLGRSDAIFNAIRTYPRMADGSCRATYRPVIFLLRKI